MNRKNSSKPWLICIDLDGTTIKTDGYTIGQLNKKAIKKVRQMGHKVCIISGRPPRSIVAIYNALELDTVVGSYNGSLIYNPKHKDHVLTSISLENDIVKEIINSDFIKQKSKSILIEKDNIPYINYLSQELFDQCNLYDTSLVVDKDFKKAFESDILVNSCIIETVSDVNFIEYSKFLEKYKDKITYRKWEKKGLPSTIIAITASAAHKANAAAIIAQYYDIPIERSMAFGDGSNDYEIIEWVAKGIKMKNGTSTLDIVRNDETIFNNNKSGLGQYLAKYFNFSLE